MSKRLWTLSSCYIVLAVQALAQGGPTLLGAGYASAGPRAAIAPGQIVRLQVTGIKTVLTTPQKATSLPLPGSLAGISVVIRQYIQHYLQFPLDPLTPVTVPIVSVEQTNLCRTATPDHSDCLTTYITVQIPYELTQNPVGNPFVYSEIVISENGTESQAFAVSAVPDRIHVITACDTSSENPCLPIVTHAAGSLVSAQSPAIPGEVVVIYAWGLGYITPGVKTGTATPTPAQPVGNDGNPLHVRFDFSPNAAPNLNASAVSAIAPAYLTSGQVALYQVNVQLPAVFPALAPCGTFVDSNLTINLRGAFSKDGAPICVQPQR